MKKIALLLLLVVGCHAKQECPHCNQCPIRPGHADDGSVAPTGWKGYSVVESNGKPHMVPEITYDPVCPDGYEIGGAKKDTPYRGYNIDTETLTTDARCWPPGMQK